jgi:hypothetical protein
VASDVERTDLNCQGCKNDRDKRHEPPRPLYLMPDAITKSSTFKRKTLGLYLCLHCDGDAIENALKEHDRRKPS